MQKMKDFLFDRQQLAESKRELPMPRFIYSLMEKVGTFHKRAFKKNLCRGEFYHKLSFYLVRRREKMSKH